MLYPLNGELLDEGMRVSANLPTHQCSERKKGVDRGERAPILVFLPLNCVGEVFSCMTCCILQIRPGARVNDGNVQVEAPYCCVEDLCVCVCVFIKLHISAQSGPVILVIL